MNRTEVSIIALQGDFYVTRYRASAACRAHVRYIDRVRQDGLFRLTDRIRPTDSNSPSSDCTDIALRCWTHVTLHA